MVLRLLMSLKRRSEELRRDGGGRWRVLICVLPVHGVRVVERI